MEDQNKKKDYIEEQKEIKSCFRCKKYLPAESKFIVIGDTSDIKYYSCEGCKGEEDSV